jgi:hypothetical protein
VVHVVIHTAIARTPNTDRHKLRHPLIFGSGGRPMRFSDTPGTIGRGDYADPDSDSNLGSPGLTLSLVFDKELRRLWDFDPKGLLLQPGLAPDFVDAAQQGLRRAARLGMRPKVNEVYRTPAESKRRYRRYKNGHGSKAADAWKSWHNYGLAMDVYLHDTRDRKIKTAYTRNYKPLAESLWNFEWGEPINDAVHFEYHPAWKRLVGGRILLKTKKWAIRAAQDIRHATDPVGPLPAEPDLERWLPYFWWAVGAGGTRPSTELLAADPLPKP